MSSDYLSLKATDRVQISTNEDVKIAINHHDAWRAGVPRGSHILALYANIALPRPGTPDREALARGGWRAWFQQYDAHEADHRDETGYLGYIPISSHAPGHLLISHSWPHTVDTDPWEFMIRIAAVDARGHAVRMGLTLSTREIKVIHG